MTAGWLLLVPFGAFCVTLIFLESQNGQYKKKQTALKLFCGGIAAPPAVWLLESFTLFLVRLFPPRLIIPARAFAGIALPEELIKLAVLSFFLRKQAVLERISDGFLYALCLSFGFSLTENILYVSGSAAPETAAALRNLLSAPLHGLSAGFMGLAASRFRLKSENHRAAGFAAACLIHGLYDWILMSDRIPDVLILPLLLLGWTVLIALLIRHRV